MFSFLLCNLFLLQGMPKNFWIQLSHLETEQNKLQYWVYILLLRHRLRREKKAYSVLKYAGNLIKICWYVLRSYFGTLPHKQIFMKLSPWFRHLVVQSVERSKVFGRIYVSVFGSFGKHYMIIPTQDIQPDCGHATKKYDCVSEVWWLLGS